MEHQGSGLGKIIDAYQNTYKYIPEVEPTVFSNRAQFTVTLKKTNIGINEANSEANLNLMMLYEIKANPKITQTALATKLAVSHSSIQRAMKGLSASGTLKRIGDTRGYWQIKE